MGIRTLKSVTPGNRFASRPDFADVTESKPEKSLTTAIRKTGGRNNHGRNTCSHRGGGHRRKERIIEFKRDKFNVMGRLDTME